MSARPTQRWLLGAWYGLTVLVLVGLAASLNRQIIVLVTEPFKKSLGFSDTQIGALNGIALSLVAALATFPMGWLADRANRLYLLAVCIAIWSLATIAFGLANTFPMLFLFAMGIAIGEAVLGPMTYSVIPDLFPREKWITANYVFYVAALLGSWVGLSTSGAILAAAASQKSWLPSALAVLEPWRIALILSTVAAPLLIILVLLIPLRRKAPTASTQTVQGLRDFFLRHRRSLAGVFIGFGLVAAANGTILVWSTPAMTRVFDVPPSEVGIITGIVMGVASVAGVLLSAFLVRRFRPRHGENTPMLVAQIAVVGAIAVTPLYLVAPDADWAYAVGAVKTMLVTCCLSLSPAILQLLAPGHMRGRVIALGGLLYILFTAASPVVVGAVSDNFFPASKDLFWSIVLVSVPAFAIGLGFLRFGGVTLPATIAESAGSPAPDATERVPAAA